MDNREIECVYCGRVNLDIYTPYFAYYILLHNARELSISIGNACVASAGNVERDYGTLDFL